MDGTVLTSGNPLRPGSAPHQPESPPASSPDSNSPVFPFWYVLILFLLLIPFCWAAFYTFPFGDDFSRAIKARHLFDFAGGIKEMFRAWWTWSGRFFHHFLIIFLGDAVTTRAGYAMLCLGHMLLYFISLLGIITTLSPGQKRTDQIFLAFFLFASLLCYYPYISGTWYLATDIFGLGVAGSLTLFYIWGLLSAWNAPVITRRIKAACFVSGCCAIGSYEYSALMVMGITLCTFILARIQRHRHIAFFKILLCVITAAFCLSIFARGNFRRQVKTDVPPELVQAHINSLFRDWWHAVRPSLTSPLLAFTAITACAVAPRGFASFPAKIFYPALLAVTTGGIFCFTGTIAVLHIPADVSIADMGKTAACFFLYNNIFVFFFFAAASGRLRETLKPQIPSWSARLVFLLLAISLLFTANYQQAAWNGLSGGFKASAAASERRIEVMQTSEDGNILFPPLIECAYPACPGDPVSPGNDDWPNKFIRRTYGGKSLARENVDPDFVYEAMASTPAFTPLDIPGSGERVSAAYVPNLLVGPNEAYRYDWLFLRFTGSAAEEQKIPDSTAFLAAQKDSILFSLLGSVFPDVQDNALGKRVTMPGFLRFQGSLRHFSLKENPYAVNGHSSEGGKLYALPLHNPSGGSLGLCYISFDGVHFEQIPLAGTGK